MGGWVGGLKTSMGQEHCIGRGGQMDQVEQCRYTSLRSSKR